MAGSQEGRVARKTLSKSILEMKFMKKSKEIALKEADAAQGIAVCGGDLIGGGRAVIEPSIATCEQLTCARRSFHGANPEIERFLESLKSPSNMVKNVKEEDTDVLAAEVARVTHASVKLHHKQPPRKKQRISS